MVAKARDMTLCNPLQHAIMVAIDDVAMNLRQRMDSATDKSSERRAGDLNLQKSDTTYLHRFHSTSRFLRPAQPGKER